MLIILYKPECTFISIINPSHKLADCLKLGMQMFSLLRAGFCIQEVRIQLAAEDVGDFLKRPEVQS